MREQDGPETFESFDSFVRRAMPELLRFGTALTGSTHDAADLAQHALEQMARRWRRINGRHAAEVFGYAKKAMTNAHISRWRRLRREHLSPAPTELAAPAVASDRAVPTEEPMWLALAALPAVAVLGWALSWGPAAAPYRRYRRRRSLSFSGQLVHEIVVQAGPDGRPGERLLAPSRSPYVGVLAEDGSRNDCVVLIGTHGSVLLVACLGRVEDRETPKQSAIHTISAIHGLGAGNLRRVTESDVVAGRLAERYMIELISGRRLLEWKFEQNGWLYAVGAVLDPRDNPERAEALGRAVLNSWQWLNDPQEIVA